MRGLAHKDRAHTDGGLQTVKARSVGVAIAIASAWLSVGASFGAQATAATRPPQRQTREPAISATASPSQPYFACAAPSRPTARPAKGFARHARATCFAIVDPRPASAATGLAR